MNPRQQLESMFRHLRMKSRKRSPVAENARRILNCERLEDRVNPAPPAGYIDPLGPNGIDSLGLGLTGANVHIGQVDVGRPGLRAVNKDNAANSHPDVTPLEVFLRNATPPAWNQDVDTQNYHATMVAGILIGKGQEKVGVAQGSLLHSSAMRAANNQDHQNALLSIEAIANANNKNVPVINMSATFGPLPNMVVDGLSQLALGVDYFAVNSPTLFVLGTANDRGSGKQIPADSYNGIVVNAAAPHKSIAKYCYVYNGGTADNNSRFLVDVVAPGYGIYAPQPTADGNGRYVFRNRSSFSS